MGKSKPFIDKKNSRHFHVVHRSLRDPLAYDDDEQGDGSKYVLQEVPSKHSNVTRDQDQFDEDDDFDSDFELTEKEKNLGMAANYGIYFEDQNEYDYLQHLKEVARSKEAVLIEAPKVNRVENKPKDVSLPSNLFASKSEIDSDMYQSLNAQDFKDSALNEELLDPDVQEVMRALEEADDYEAEFDEEFISQLNQDSLGNCQLQDSDKYDSDYANFSDDEIKPKYKISNSVVSKRQSRLETLSQMSLTSSVMFRNKNLTQLDDQFEKVLEDYDDEQVGELHPLETVGEDLEDISDEEQLELLDIQKLEQVMDEFLEQNNVVGNRLCQYKTGKEGMAVIDEMRQELKDGVDIDNLIRNKYQFVSEDLNDSSLSDSDEDSIKERKWDCQTILTSYSNTENIPKSLNLLACNSLRKPQTSIKISKKTGLPLVLHHQDKIHSHVGDTDDQVVLTGKVDTSIGISKEETLEEKRIRKQQVKEQKKLKRELKKCKKLSEKCDVNPRFRRH